MAKKGNRVKIILESSESAHCYYTWKNKKNQTARLEIKKYDPVVRRKVTFKEKK
jgi:large subunit ribosomal protein L33